MACPVIIDIPKDIAEWRALLFELRTPLKVPYVTFHEHWQFVRNAWFRQGCRRLNTQTMTRTEIWYCRNRRSGCKSATATGVRNRKVREVERCNMQLRLTEHWVATTAGPVPDHVELIAFGKQVQHNHTLDDIDKYKRNPAIMAVAAEWVNSGGLSVADVNAAMKSDKNVKSKQRVVDAGGKWMTRQDIANAATRAMRTQTQISGNENGNRNESGSGNENEDRSEYHNEHETAQGEGEAEDQRREADFNAP
ncbi:hypothetical protein LTR50_003838 [Elasticomyces elasticus]|nr:hypothetical protein LTR50_003838 [Elasticomyces elasticus]